MAQKPSLPSGTRDFSSDQLAKRNHILSVCKEVFELYGYEPLETPAFEKLETLTGKYGDEGDQLLFKILNSGDFLKDVKDENLSGKNSKALVSQIVNRGLRYDLTIPFARYVVMNQHNITFPFKRYQIQPVWRADRPQKGRYREFYQCDVDVIGSISLLNEFELIQIYLEVFERLGLTNITVKVNNRKLLLLFGELLNAPDRFVEIVTILDKYDKIGKEGVNKILFEKGLSTNADKLWEAVESFQTENLNTNRLNSISSLSKSEAFQIGVAEMEELLALFDSHDSSNVEFDIMLARGLTYYTGTVMEVVCNDVSIGSIGGGGRYDDLTGIFGLPNVSGVGVSFGLERIYDVMEELDLFEDDLQPSTQVMFVNFGEPSLKRALQCARDLRKNFVSVEVYPDEAKMKKQMKYANNKKIAYVAMLGESELKQGVVNLKNMETGEQQTIPIDNIKDVLDEE